MSIEQNYNHPEGENLVNDSFNVGQSGEYLQTDTSLNSDEEDYAPQIYASLKDIPDEVKKEALTHYEIWLRNMHPELADNQVEEEVATAFQDLETLGIVILLDESDRDHKEIDPNRTSWYMEKPSKMEPKE